MFYAIMVTGAWLIWHLVFRIRVVGKENLPRDGKGFVLAPNHISAIDPVFVVIARFWGKRMLIMAKEELFEVNPVLSWMFLRERIGARTVAGIACAALGIGLFSLDKGSAHNGVDASRALLGNLLVFAAVVCEASYVVIGKRLTEGLGPKRISAIISGDPESMFFSIQRIASRFGVTDRASKRR